jgi:hypothetical protein
MPGVTEVATTERDGSGLILLGQVAPVSALGWTSQLPGGDATLTAALTLPVTQRHAALRPGRLVKAWRGGTVWEGTLAEPTTQSGTWQITANGIGTYGNNFQAAYSAWDGVNGANVPSRIINEAVARGLLWATVPAGIGVGPPLLDYQVQFDSASKTLTEALNGLCAAGGLTWEITRLGHKVKFHALPTAPTRLLLAPDPPGRTVAGHYNGLWVKYRTTVAAELPSPATREYINKRQADRWGPLEAYADYTAADPMTAAWPNSRAGGFAAGVLAKTPATSYTNSFAVVPGQVLTLGGVPVDLGCERAGEVYKVIGATQGWGGDDPNAQIIFVGGGYQWDDSAEAASIAPYNIAGADLSSVMQAMMPAPSPAPK